MAANRALEALASQIRSDPALADIFERHEPAADRKRVVANCRRIVQAATVLVRIFQRNRRREPAPKLRRVGNQVDALVGLAAALQGRVVEFVVAGVARHEPQDQRFGRALEGARVEGGAVGERDPAVLGEQGREGERPDAEPAAGQGLAAVEGPMD